MGNLPTITEADIRERIGSTSFERGLRYFRDGAIQDARRQGMRLKARCEGSAPDPYRVWVEFGEAGIVAADCSCPVGSGGRCKHTAALLLTWIDQPGLFREVAEVDAVLQQRSREQLIALVKQMLLQEPDLEELLEEPPAAPGAEETVTAETYRRQADLIFRRVGREWGVGAEIAHRLREVLATGAALLTMGRPVAAAAVYEGVALSVFDQQDVGEYDEEGDVMAVPGACTEGLAACLKSESDSARREAILRGLFAVYQANAALTEWDSDADVVDTILENTTPEEQRTVAQWLRGLVGPKADPAQAYLDPTHGDLLFGLEAETLDDETFLRIARARKETEWVVDRLLQLGRVEEVVAETRGVNDLTLTRIADLLIAYDQADAGEQLILRQARAVGGGTLLEWLQNRYARTGNQAAELEVAEERFRQMPSFPGYEKARELARALGQWDAVRPGLIEVLQKKNAQRTLAEVHLDEGELGPAIELARSAHPSPATYWQSEGIGSDLKLRIAAAAEADRPQDALEIYRAMVEDAINARGRESYMAAARYLQRVRALYRQIGHPEEWRTLIARIREEHRTLRALKEELANAGL